MLSKLKQQPLVFPCILASREKEGVPLPNRLVVSAHPMDHPLFFWSLPSWYSGLQKPLCDILMEDNPFWHFPLKLQEASPVSRRGFLWLLIAGELVRQVSVPLKGHRLSLLPLRSLHLLRGDIAGKDRD